MYKGDTPPSSPPQCRHLSHCASPSSRQRFTSKQDVIRHYNMHKKRDNSLQHGFMRFSPLDDCSVYYHGCHLNGKSTHYHCMQVTVPSLGTPFCCCGEGAGTTVADRTLFPRGAHPQHYQGALAAVLCTTLWTECISVGIHNGFRADQLH